MFRNSGHVVMITGGSEGLGLSVARAFATAGAAVSIAARHPGPLAAAREAIAELGADVVAEASDVSDPIAVGHWFRRTVEELGPPDTLINNASILGSRVPLIDYPIDEWRRVLDVNLTGSLITIQAVLPTLIGRERGSIINVSSGAAIPPRPRWGAYAVSKDAVDGLTLTLAEELRGTGVRINAVDPGAMRTAMRAAAYPEEDRSKLKDPSRIAEVFLWLAGPATREVSGQRIIADQWIRSRES